MYKRQALSSKSTGSGAAAPLWQAYMNKIHKGLSNRDILEGSGSDYGLVKVTTCAVSGQLATDACEHDVMGYGTVTDWWAKGTEPTVYCQMHTAQEVCVESGEPAGPYCTNTETRGVISIPVGHPLYKFIGTRYEETLTEFLGTTVSTNGGYCSLHMSAANSYGVNNYGVNSYGVYDYGVDTYGVDYYGTDNYGTDNYGTDNYAADNYGTDTYAVQAPDPSLTQDAQMLIDVAYSMVGGMDPSGAQYNAIWTAIGNLQGLLNNGYAASNDIVSAMGALSSAMAGIY